MKVVFLGTPSFGIKALEAINNSSHTVLAVVSQPDKEKDRKGNIVPTPIKRYASELNLPVYQFNSVSKEGLQIIRDLKPEIIVTAAFGQLLSEEFLSIPKHGVLNIHGSILPAYRGASPIQSAILNGEKASGITIMKTVHKMDAGDILISEVALIDDTTTFGSYCETLSIIGARLIVKALDLVESGTAVFIPQDEKKATYTKKTTKQDAHLDFSQPAKILLRKVNAFNPSPSAYAFYKNDNLKIHTVKAIEYDGNENAGTIIKASGEELIVKCGEGALKILCLQAPSKSKLNSAEFLRGYKLEVGSILC